MKTIIKAGLLAVTLLGGASSTFAATRGMDAYRVP